MAIRLPIVGRPPGAAGRSVVALLPVDRNVAKLAGVGFNNFSLCTNIPPDPQQGS
jgi:hypothetical protein